MDKKIELGDIVAKMDAGEDIQEIASKYADQLSEEHFSEPFNIRELQRSDLLELLNCTYIAKRFFGKSLSWFSQKLNNNIKNGKPAEFTEEERAILKRALFTISLELEEFSEEL